MLDELRLREAFGAFSKTERALVIRVLEELNAEPGSCGVEPSPESVQVPLPAECVLGPPA